jgi:hypothetical protein
MRALFCLEIWTDVREQADIHIDAAAAARRRRRNQGAALVLKRLLRQHGLRCVTLRELAADETNQNTHTDFPPSARAR